MSGGLSAFAFDIWKDSEMIALPTNNLPMSDTDLAVLNEILKQKKAELDPSASDSEFWEFFSAQQILGHGALDCCF